MDKIWIVDDDNLILDKLYGILKQHDYDVRVFLKPEEILIELDKEKPAVVIVDLFFKNSNLSGDAIVSKVVSDCTPTQVVIISGQTDFKRTLNSLQSGALDFIEKPISLPRFLTTIKNGLTIYNSQKNKLDKSLLLGNSVKTKSMIKKIRKLATLNEPVLIQGESGVGKELVAQNIHLFSSRFAHPLKEINCTSFNKNLIESELFGHKKGSFTGALVDKKGVFELANKSSLFLDEIGDIPFDIQAKLLRVLQEKKVIPVGSDHDIRIDSRLIFATHRNLAQLIKKGDFREDFYFRISTFTIDIPPLRERIEDIDQLAPHFLQSFLMDNKLSTKEFSSCALNKLKKHHYSGNIRELIQIVKNSAFFSEGDLITSEDIIFNSQPMTGDFWQKVNMMTLSEGKAFFEKEFLMRRLKQHNNNIEKCAKSLGIIRNNMYRKLYNHGIKK